MRALETAMQAAARELRDLSGRVNVEAAGIIGFQLALLDDAALIEPALAAIAEGASADHAWCSALDSEIANDEQAEDGYFRARAADFRDLRDRVLGYLYGVQPALTAPGAILVADDLPPSRFLAIDGRAAARSC